MRIIVNGCTGHMGQLVMELLNRGTGGHSLAAGIGRSCVNGAQPGLYATPGDYTGEADCVVDFSNHEATAGLLEYCLERSLPVVIATTGHTAEEKRLIAETAKKIPVFFSANMSVGVALLVSLAKRAAQMFPEADIEIIEKHHNRKQDVPSGTALMLAEGIASVREGSELVVGRHTNGRRKKGEISIHSLRMGDEVGTHEVIIAAGSQTITLKHEAENRALFAEGALTAAAFLEGKPAGLYTMAELIG